MSRRLLRLLSSSIVLVCSAVLTGCGGGGGSGTVGGGGMNPAPAPVTLASYYSGTETNNGTSAPIAISVVQNGSTVTGTWGNQFSGVANVGSLVGSVNGNQFSATLSSSITYNGQPLSCPSSVTGTVSGNAITGSFASTSGCNSPQSGTFTLQQSYAPPAFSPNANGTINDALAGTGTISATLSQTGVTISGTYGDTFTSGSPGSSGTFYGVVIGSNVYFDLIPSQSGSCPFTALGAINGSSVSGSYTAVLCGATDSGTFSFSQF